VWEPKSEARDPVSKVWESACGVWELKGMVWDLSSHQLPLNLTPGIRDCATEASCLEIIENLQYAQCSKSAPA